MPPGDEVKKGRGGLGSLLFKDPERAAALFATEPKAQPARGRPATAAPAAPSSQGFVPERISLSSLIPGVTAGEVSVVAKPVAQKAKAAQGSPERVAQLIEAARGQVSPENPTLRLSAQMATLEAYIPDEATRRAAALDTLKAQGISPEDIKRGVAEVRGTLEACFSKFLEETEMVRNQNVTQRRQSAQALREQVSGLESQIAELKAQAAQLEAAAAASNNDLDEFVADVQTARSAAMAQFGVLAE